jgi:hypothetical protein
MGHPLLDQLKRRHFITLTLLGGAARGLPVFDRTMRQLKRGETRRRPVSHINFDIASGLTLKPVPR